MAEPQSPSPDVQLADEESRARIAKLHLEQQSLSTQLSRQGKALEWVKALGTPVALIGAVWTIFSGLNQIQLERASKDEERLERSVAKLLSDKSNERLAGVSTLARFFSQDDEKQQVAAIVAFADALSREEDPVVRAAILETIKNASSSLPTRTLGSGLTSIITRNRVLQQSLEIKPRDSSFQTIPKEKLGTLDATSQAIVALVRGGAHVLDMSRIYCVRCDFSGKQINLDGVDFSSSILFSSDFSGASLEHTNFDGANLLDTEFIGSRLSFAKLTDLHGMQAATGTIRDGRDAPAPNFSCADLSGVDFSKQVLLGVSENRTPNQSSFWNANFNGSNLSGADLSTMDVFVVTELPQPLDPQNDLPADLPFVGKSKQLNDPIEDSDPKATPRYVILFSGSDLKLHSPIPSRFSGFQDATTELSRAKNLDKAKLPPQLLRYMKMHPAGVAGRPDVSECKPSIENLAQP
jgi:Pentapeptide repeats (8 copies)